MYTHVNHDADQRKSALIAGSLLMVMIVASAFSYGFAHTRLFDSADADAALGNIIAHTMLLKAEILGWLLILACDLLVAWACYVFLKPINNHLSLLGAWLRLTYSAILGTAMMNLLFIQLLATRTNESSSYSSKQLGEQVLLHLKAFDATWSVGLIIFGGHLLVLGILALKSRIVPAWIGILLLMASLGYVLIHLFNVWGEGYEGVRRGMEIIFFVPMTVGEAGFGIWLLIRGGKVPGFDNSSTSNRRKLSS